MSALGQTFCTAIAMSALPPKADIRSDPEDQLVLRCLHGEWVVEAFA